MLIRDGNRNGIERFFLKNIASKNRIETHEKNPIKNCMGYMMKKSAIFVDGENESKSVLGDDTIHAILVLRAINWDT